MELAMYKQALKQRQVDMYERQDFDALIKADKWKNLYFTKDGKNFTGTVIFITEQNAKSVAIELTRQEAVKVEIVCENGMFNLEDFSHHMQIPVK